MNFLLITWWVFFLAVILGMIVDVLTFRAWQFTDMTHIDTSFFMFYSAWYSTQRKKELTQ